MSSEPARNQPSTYAKLAVQIARISWARACATCMDEVGEDGGLMDVHFNENNLGAPCDMLARLGVMRDLEVSHSFPANWSPLDEVKLSRHAGEPTENDLILGLSFYVRWCSSEAELHNRYPAGPAIVSTPVEQTSRKSVRERNAVWQRNLIWAVQGGCELLSLLNAGAWDAAGNFSPRPEYDDTDEYWRSRQDMIVRCGGANNIYPFEQLRC